MSTPSNDEPPSAWAVPARFVWRIIYGLYAWTVFVVLSLSAVCTALLPGVHRRRLAAQRASRALLKICLLYTSRCV